MDGDLSVTLAYDSNPMGRRDQGPGWYVSAIHSGEQEWLVGPVKISPSEAATFAAILSILNPRDRQAIQTAVRDQSVLAHQRLITRVESLRRAVQQLEQAEADLKAFIPQVPTKETT